MHRHKFDDNKETTHSDHNGGLRIVVQCDKCEAIRTRHRPGIRATGQGAKIQTTITDTKKD